MHLIFWTILGTRALFTGKKKKNTIPGLMCTRTTHAGLRPWLYAFTKQKIFYYNTAVVGIARKRGLNQRRI